MARRGERRTRRRYYTAGTTAGTPYSTHTHTQNLVYLEHPVIVLPHSLSSSLSLVHFDSSHLPRVEQRTLGPFRRGEVAQHAIDPPPPVEIRKRRRVGDHMPHRGHSGGIPPPPSTACAAAAVRVPAPPPSSSLGDNRVKRACRCTICPPLLCPAMTTRRSLGYLRRGEKPQVRYQPITNQLVSLT